MSSSQFATSQLATRRKFDEQMKRDNNFAVQTTRNVIQEVINPQDSLKNQSVMQVLSKQNSKPTLETEGNNNRNSQDFKQYDLEKRVQHYKNKPLKSPKKEKHR